MATKKRELKSKAKNAYDLLRDVCKVILEEPRRYNQYEWFTRSERVICSILRASGVAKPKPPACGTMACRAGWIVQLHDGEMARSGKATEERAYEILDAREWGAAYRTDYDEDVSLLFSGGALHYREDHGTAAYARAGVKGLRAFMAKHKARLKATKFSRSA